MNKRKILLLVSLFTFFVFISFWQLGGTHNYLDTAYIAPEISRSKMIF